MVLPAAGRCRSDIVRCSGLGGFGGGPWAELEGAILEPAAARWMGDVVEAPRESSKDTGGARKSLRMAATCRVESEGEARAQLQQIKQGFTTREGGEITLIMMTEPAGDGMARMRRPSPRILRVERARELCR